MDALRELSAAGAVLLLLAGCLWWLRHKGVARFGARGGPRVLQVVERTALSPHHSLHLVRLAGRGLLVGVSPAGCTLLESFEWDRLELPAGCVAEARR
jgi:flagellar biosynthetic protein FliO